MVQIQYWDGSSWVDVGNAFINETIAWISLGNDDVNYRTVEVSTGEILTDKKQNSD